METINDNKILFYLRFWDLLLQTDFIFLKNLVRNSHNLTFIHILFPRFSSIIFFYMVFILYLQVLSLILKLRNKCLDQLQNTDNRSQAYLDFWGQLFHILNFSLWLDF